LAHCGKHAMNALLHNAKYLGITIFREKVTMGEMVGYEERMRREFGEPRGCQAKLYAWADSQYRQHYGNFDVVAMMGTLSETLGVQNQNWMLMHSSYMFSGSPGHYRTAVEMILQLLHAERSSPMQSSAFRTMGSDEDDKLLIAKHRALDDATWLVCLHIPMAIKRPKNPKIPPICQGGTTQVSQLELEAKLNGAHWATYIRARDEKTGEMSPDWWWSLDSRNPSENRAVDFARGRTSPLLVPTERIAGLECLSLFTNVPEQFLS